jgi:CheY-like chemotaxis protein
MSRLEIFLAEDDIDDRTFFEEALSVAEVSAKLTSFTNGKQLTDYLATVESPPPPDIIFLDINMPVKNGMHCLKEIRAEEKFSKVPIIIFSTSSLEKDIDKSYQFGADKYIVKSYSFDQDVQVLKKIFTADWETFFTARSKDNYLVNA